MDKIIYRDQDRLDLGKIPSIPENIVIDANYVHTDNNYTMSEKQKLSNLNEFDKGAFTTSEALILAYPSGQLGWKAIVGETDTLWVWDVETSQWVDSGAKVIFPTKTSDLINDSEFISISLIRRNINFTGTILLDILATTYNRIQITTNTTPTTPSQSRVDMSCAGIEAVGDGSHDLLLTNYVNDGNLEYDKTNGIVNNILFAAKGSKNYFRIIEQYSMVLSTPSNFTATANGQTQIDLAFTRNSTFGNLQIEISDNGTIGWSILGTVASGVTTYIHTGLTANTTKYYRIKELGDNGTTYYDSSYVSANATTSNAQLVYSNIFNMNVTGGQFYSTLNSASLNNKICSNEAFSGDFEIRGILYRNGGNGHSLFFGIGLTSDFPTYVNQDSQYGSFLYSVYTYDLSVFNGPTTIQSGTGAAQIGDIIKIKRVSGVVTFSYIRSGAEIILKSVSGINSTVYFKCTVEDYLVGMSSVIKY